MNKQERPQDELQALAALRARQGKGARFDSPAAPASELLLARRGAAYFARKLNELDDVALDGESLDGISRRLILARVGYEARSMARIAEAAREGRAAESLGDPEQVPDDEVLGASLPAHALRYLLEHAQAHLNVEWRDLADEAWDRMVVSLKGHRVTPRATVRARAVTLWFNAIALGNGGRLRDIPIDIRPTTIGATIQQDRR